MQIKNFAVKENKMDFYKITLQGMKKFLNDCNKTHYADIIENCINKWDKNQNVDCLINEFSATGAFNSFELNPSDFQDDEKFYWSEQLFSAIVAMAVQLAHFAKEKKNTDINFIRRNFGRPTEIISGTNCSHCGFRQINCADIDKYISSSVIAERIVDGLETNTLNENIDAVVSLSAPEIKRRREQTKARIINSSIPFSQSRTNQTFCLLCGSKDMKECHFLKSLKDFIFVPLNK